MDTDITDGGKPLIFIKQKVIIMVLSESKSCHEGSCRIRIAFMTAFSILIYFLPAFTVLTIKKARVPKRTAKNTGRKKGDMGFALTSFNII